MKQSSHFNTPKSVRVSEKRFGNVVDLIRKQSSGSVLGVATMSSDQAFSNLLEANGIIGSPQRIKEIYESTIKRNDCIWSLTSAKDDLQLYPYYIGSNPENISTINKITQFYNDKPQWEMQVHLIGEGPEAFVGSGSLDHHNGFRWTEEDLINWIIKAKEVLLQKYDYTL